MAVKTPSIQSQMLESIDELRRAVIGYNGTTGLITMVQVILERQENQDKRIERLEKNGLDNDKITFKWLVEKLGAPVIVGVMVALLVANLVK